MKIVIKIAYFQEILYNDFTLTTVISIVGCAATPEYTGVFGKNSFKKVWYLSFNGISCHVIL